MGVKEWAFRVFQLIHLGGAIAFVGFGLAPSVNALTVVYARGVDDFEEVFHVDGLVAVRPGGHHADARA